MAEDLNEQSSSNPYKQLPKLRSTSPEKRLNDNKKKKPTFSNWDKLRDNISEYTDNVNSFATSPSSYTAAITASSRSPTPKLYQSNKKQSLNPFRSSTFDSINHDPKSNLSLANTTLVAAQAAGMTNFTRNFRPVRHQNGAIYATSTAVQQDIYKLERDLEKILSQLTTRSQHASFAESASTLDSTVVPTDTLNPNPTFARKSMFQKQAVVDLFHNTAASLNIDTIPPIKYETRSEVTRVSNAMTMIMNSMKKHKSATRLPLTGEILALLAAPFDRSPLIVADCEQAIDVFEYIRSRFVQLDANEHFEQLMFCCRLLGSGDLYLKKRALQILNSQLLPCKNNPSFLPSTPQSYHSLIYTLINALVKLSFHRNYHHTDINEHVINSLEADEEFLRKGIISVLDELANGSLIPPMGEAWTQYHTSSSTTLPTSISQLCVVEGLCKCVMVGICSQNDPYHEHYNVSQPIQLERSRDMMILQELLPRYWAIPDMNTRPAFLKVIFLLTELASETFLMATIDDLKIKNTTASLLLPVIVENLSPEKLRDYLADRDTDEAQHVVATNVIVMLLCLLSICSLEEKTNAVHEDMTSPMVSPRPSINDFSSENISLDGNEYQSINSLNMNVANDAAMRKLLLTLKGYIEEFWKSGYKEYIIRCTDSMHQDATGERVARVYTNLVFHITSEMGEEIAKHTIPTLFKRLVNTFPPATPSFRDMLFDLSKRYKTFFYKPVVSCVASNDEQKVTHAMSLITCLRRYLSGVQFWMQDAEMINVLLLSNVGQPKKPKTSEKNLMPGSQSSTPQANSAPSEAQWGHTTLGQCVVAAEFMWAIKELRHKQKDPQRNMEEDEIAKKFLIDLERRLAVFLTAKEKTSLVPLPLRVILCNIFNDIRFFCNTTHRPGWLTRAIDWACQPITSTPEHVYQHVLPIINAEESPAANNPYADNRLPVLHTGHLADSSLMFQRIHNVYLQVIEELQDESNEYTDYGGYFKKTGEQQNESQTDDRSIEIKRHKRYHVIYSMYPISQTAALTLDLRPSLKPSVTGENNNELEMKDGPALKLAKYRFEHMEEINQNSYGSVFSLLATVYTTLSSQEFNRLVRPLWESHMEDRKPQSFIPAVFLLMECGEKIPKTMIEVCTHDFYSGDPLRRLAVIQKYSSLSAFRFNVLNQEYIPISSRRRPFKGDGGAFSTSFVPTDLGSNQFSLDEPRWMAKLKNASNFPIELKRQIQELGWDDDDNGEEHEALKKVLTPLALLPSLFLEEEEDRMNEDENQTSVKQNGKKVDISKLITRRKRATTIHSLTIAFLSMVDLLNDDFGGASNALRELLEYFLRDDPSLFLRAFLNDLGKFKLDRHRDMLTRLRYLVSMQHKLPPYFTHILFNYLAGMLKWLTRENKKKDGLILMTLIHPILAELILSTNDLSIRELRKNKIEHLLVSTGRFWFTHEQPAELFPRYLSNTKSSLTVLDIPQEVFYVALLRISHIQFLTNYLIRYPREVYAVKKTLQDYEPMPISGSKQASRWSLDETYYPDITRRRRHQTNSYVYRAEEHFASPSINDRSNADLDDVNAPMRQPSQQQIDTEMLSALRARIWLRFVDILLNGLNKNYNDRDELERILQGINVIITEHDRDFGIIGQALILYTRVVTRFKRLFVSNRGYTTFLPALFKVFCEVDCFPQVRSAIIFAWCRFYAVHEESFVFQMLGTLIPTILNAYNKSEELGSWMIDNLFVLMQAMHDPPLLGATSDVLGLQLQVELDDHERSIQERIDAVSNPMAMPLSTAIFKPLARSVTAPIAPLEIISYNNRSFELQGFIKLFLTIIAYDPGSLRAEQFVKTFRHMIPRFHKLPMLKDLVDEGIAALVDVFTKFSKHAKVTATTVNTNTSNVGYQSVASNTDDGRVPGANARTESAQQAYGKQWQQNDKLTIRKEFVLLVHEYLKHDGSLSEADHGKMALIIRNVMKDYGNVKGLVVKTDWLRDYLVDCFHSMADMKNYTKPFKKLLSQILTQYRSQWKTMEISDLYEGLAILLEQGQGKPMNVHDIAGFINEKFIPHGLNIATRYNWEGNTKEFTKFCNTLARLIIAIMENSTQDILGTIEQQVPTPSLIGYIIIPICLQYNLQWNFNNVSVPTRFRPDPTSNWTRLLNYISRACSQASLLKSKSSLFSLSNLTSSMGQTTQQDPIDAAEFADMKDGKQSPQSIALLFSLSFVAMKIILVRGSESFNKLKGSWAQVGYYIKTALVFGQTLKFLKPKSGRSTPNIPNTPVATVVSPGGPLSAGYSAGIGQSSPDTRTTFSFTAPLGTSTIYDFTTWRFLEFVMSYRCPLYVYLKDFMQEKLLQLNSGNQNRSSFYAPPSPGPRGSMNFPSSSAGGYSPGGFAHSDNVSHTRWRSWGGDSSVNLDKRSSQEQPLSSIGVIPQVNIQDADAPKDNSANVSSLDGSPTYGLGLHVPSKSTSNNPYFPSSPASSFHPPSEFLDNESGSAPAISLHSPSSKRDFNRPVSSISSSGAPGLFNNNQRDANTSTVLHILHAESITSITHVQMSMGLKPALPWLATKRQNLKHWNQREAIIKLSNEWQLLLQLYAETDLSISKLNSNTANPQATPLM